MESPSRVDHPASLPDSLWAATTPGLSPLSVFDDRAFADVAIVGAGFMGLSTALGLAEAGVDVVVLEAADIGWGASGRNNGLLVPGLKRDPGEVRRLLGRERGDRLTRFAGDAPSAVFELIEECAIQCDVNRGGWIQAAHSSRALATIDKRVSEWNELGAGVDLIGGDDLTGRLGTGYYYGAWFDSRGGSINPLAYVRGLAGAALAAGARVHVASPVTEIVASSGGWKILTPHGSLRAEVVVCCTNAYGGIKQTQGFVLPLRTAQVASAPLPDEQARTILPGGESASDTQRLLTSFRLTRDRRLIMGGASATAGDHHKGLIKRLHQAARDRFPQLGDIDWEYGWSGFLALTRDHLPGIFRISDGFYAGVGCNGRGIAMATVTGRCIADLLNGGAEVDSPVPVGRLRRFRGYRLRYPGVAVSVRLNRLLDRAERLLSH